MVGDSNGQTGTADVIENEHAFRLVAPCQNRPEAQASSGMITKHTLEAQAVHSPGYWMGTLAQTQISQVAGFMPHSCNVTTTFKKL